MSKRYPRSNSVHLTERQYQVWRMYADRLGMNLAASMRHLFDTYVADLVGYEKTLTEIANSIQPDPVNVQTKKDKEVPSPPSKGRAQKRGKAKKSKNRWVSPKLTEEELIGEETILPNGADPKQVRRMQEAVVANYAIMEDLIEKYLATYEEPERIRAALNTLARYPNDRLPYELCDILTSWHSLPKWAIMDAVNSWEIAGRPLSRKDEEITDRARIAVARAESE
jgi:hypothetical protein